MEDEAMVVAAQVEAMKEAPVATGMVAKKAEEVHLAEATWVSRRQDGVPFCAAPH